MAVVQILAAQTAAWTSALVDIPAGTVKTYAAFGLSGSSGGEYVEFQIPDNAGTYVGMRVEANNGVGAEARISRKVNLRKVEGPIRIKIYKSVTADPVEIVEYT